MKITALVENRTNCEVAAQHGLSLFIETAKHKILFDLGPDETIFRNAALLKIDLGAVDIVVISHGHYDHGGALKAFLDFNSRAKVYIQEAAFGDFFSKPFDEKIPIGLDKSLKNHPQVVLLKGDFEIDGELKLFTVAPKKEFRSPANDTLFCGNTPDEFLHEQNLIIREKSIALIMGCGHSGVLNILESARHENPNICVGGFHLFNPRTKETAPKEFLDFTVAGLKKYPDIDFYACHCTGKDAFDYLQKRLPKMKYFSCGETLRSAAKHNNTRSFKPRDLGSQVCAATQMGFCQ